MITAVDGVPVLGLLGDSGSGKTTLLVALAGLLRARGLAVGCVKHSHHEFEPDGLGKDSQRLRAAGARQVLLTTPTRWALFDESPEPPVSDLVDVLRRLSLATLDVVLVEGYRRAALPRIEIHRHARDGNFRAPRSEDVIAVASDQAPTPACELPSFALDDARAIADFIVLRLRLQAAPPRA